MSYDVLCQTTCYVIRGAMSNDVLCHKRCYVKRRAVLFYLLDNGYVKIGQTRMSAVMMNISMVMYNSKHTCVCYLLSININNIIQSLPHEDDSFTIIVYTIRHIIMTHHGMKTR